MVIEALQRVAKRALRNRVATLLAAVAFIAIFAFGVPFPVVVAAAALIGWQGARTRPDLFLPVEKKDAAGLVDRLIEAEAPHTRPDLGRAIRIALACLLLWFGPLVLAALWLGADHVLVTAGLFFSKMAVVTFGGAYAVLAYVGQEAVGHFGWLTPEDMLAGLALAETTPGPLILVLTFVGFLAAHGAAAPFDPVTAGLLGALVATWTTFVPCFLWILVGAPWVESLRGVKGLAAALSGITAAVVGVILNLAVFFAVHVLFETVGSWSLGPLALPLPDLASFDWRAGLIALGAMIATFRFHTGMIPTLVGAALAGVVLRVLL
ncbi:MAG: chromate transporter [Alphaproteobacteria bacterium]|nr:chromate transporter [Alphaproteobacteria bacterium]